MWTGRNIHWLPGLVGDQGWCCSRGFLHAVGIQMLKDLSLLKWSKILWALFYLKQKKTLMLQKCSPKAWGITLKEKWWIFTEQLNFESLFFNLLPNLENNKNFHIYRRKLNIREAKNEHQGFYFVMSVFIPFLSSLSYFGIEWGYWEFNQEPHTGWTSIVPMIYVPNPLLTLYFEIVSH